MPRISDIRSSQKWRVTVASLRGVLTAAVLVAMFYLLPLDGDARVSAVLKVAIGFVVFLGLMTWQLRAIAQSNNPGLRALESILLAVPLFLLLFAAMYYMMSRADGANFTERLSRTDALYFSMTMFSTVGFGDITPRTETARLVVTAQMLLDLVILGLGVRLILTAVQRGRDRLTSEADNEAGGAS